VQVRYNLKVDAGQQPVGVIGLQHILDFGDHHLHGDTVRRLQIFGDFGRPSGRGDHDVDDDIEPVGECHVRIRIHRPIAMRKLRPAMALKFVDSVQPIARQVTAPRAAPRLMHLPVRQVGFALLLILETRGMSTSFVTLRNSCN
jgi:hypothetical protein